MSMFFPEFAHGAYRDNSVGVSDPHPVASDCNSKVIDDKYFFTQCEDDNNRATLMREA
jgi:hypothetical protein